MCTQSYDYVKDTLEALMMVEQDTGITLESDGCSDVNRRPLINFIATTPDGGRFIK